MHPQLVLSILVSLAVSTSALAQEAGRNAWRQAITASLTQDFTNAAKLATEAHEEGFRHPQLDYQIGRWSFRAGDFKTSVKSFDRYLKKVPDRSISLWERGISCYYAGDYKAGAQQFVDYQKYHNNDVENAVWRYLCQMKLDGKEKARQAILPIKNDRRVPMMEVYQLFKGENSPDGVLQALTASKADGEAAKKETMHAHLYLGLYYDSEGKPKLALPHLKTAAKQFKAGDYMWSVAVVHEKRLAKKLAAKTEAK